MTSHARAAHANREAHATGRQGWTVLVGLLALAVGGIILYLSRLSNAV